MMSQLDLIDEEPAPARAQPPRRMAPPKVHRMLADEVERIVDRMVGLIHTFAPQYMDALPTMLQRSIDSRKADK